MPAAFALASVVADTGLERGLGYRHDDNKHSKAASSAKARRRRNDNIAILLLLGLLACWYVWWQYDDGLAAAPRASSQSRRLAGTSASARSRMDWEPQHAVDWRMSDSPEEADTMVIKSCHPDMPLWEEVHNVLPPGEFGALRAALLAHPDLAPLGRLGPDGLGSKGVTTHFTLEGAERLRQHPTLGVLYPLFERMRLPGTNAFIMNLLVFESNGDFPPDAGVFGIHRDMKNSYDGITWHKGQGLELYSHATSVFYAALPADLAGGNLWLWDPARNLAAVGTPDYTARPAAVLPPHENTMVTFRGDAYHGVSGLNTPARQPRISVVLEQYKAPAWLEAHLWPWELRAYANAYTNGNVHGQSSYREFPWALEAARGTSAAGQRQGDGATYRRLTGH